MTKTDENFSTLKRGLHTKAQSRARRARAWPGVYIMNELSLSRVLFMVMLIIRLNSK